MGPTYISVISIRLLRTELKTHIGRNVNTPPDTRGLQRRRDGEVLPLLVEGEEPFSGSEGAFAVGGEDSTVVSGGGETAELVETRALVGLDDALAALVHEGHLNRRGGGHSGSGQRDGNS